MFHKIPFYVIDPNREEIADELIFVRIFEKRKLPNVFHDLYISALPFQMQEQDVLDRFLKLGQDCGAEVVTRSVAEGELLIPILHFMVFPSASDDLCILFHLE